MKRLLIVLGATVMVVGACGGIAENAAESIIEQAIESEGGGDVDIDFDGAGDGEFNVSVDGEDGELSYSVGGGEMPTDFPIPMPDGGNVLSSSTQESGDDRYQAVVVEYPGGEYDSLVSEYVDYFSGVDDVQHQTSSGDGFETESWFSADSALTVAVSRAGDVVTVTASAQN